MYRDKSLNQTNRVANLIPNTDKPTLYEFGTISRGNTLKNLITKLIHMLGSYGL